LKRSGQPSSDGPPPAGFEKSAPSLSLGKAGEFKDGSTLDTGASLNLKAPVPSREFDPISGQKFWRLFGVAF
jgi:hypothetical protein